MPDSTKTKAQLIAELAVLRASDQRYRNVVNGSLEGVWELDADGLTVFTNPMLGTMLGYAEQEMLGKPFWNFAFEEDALLAQQKFSERKLGKSDKYELRFTRKNGKPMWTEISTQPLFKSGHIIGAFAFVSDISERKRAEMILQARFRLMQFSATHSLEELLVATLDEAEDLTGSRAGFFHFLNPDQKTLLLQAWSTRTTREMCRAEGRGQHYAIAKAGVWGECVHKRQAVIHNDYMALPHRKGLPPGHTPVVRELVVPVFRHGQIVAIVGIGNKATDYDAADVEAITLLADMAWGMAERKQVEQALRESEEKFRIVADFTYDWEMWLGPDGNYLYNSPSCERITGYSAKEFADTPELSVDIVHPDDRDSYLAHIERHMTTGDLGTIEYRIITKDGAVRWISHYCQGVRDSQGNTRGRRASNRDITERKREEQFREDVEQIIRHDIKSPLISVFSMAQLAIKGKADEGMMELFPQIVRGIQQVVNLLDAAEPIRKMEKGEYTPRREPLKLLQVLCNVTDCLAQLATQRKVSIAMPSAADYPSQVEPLVYGEGFLIEDMLMNLMKNAVEASPTGGVVTVTHRAEHAEQHIAIHNRGVIPENVRARFFEKYISAGKAFGTGLGTYSAQLVAKAHGGRIEFTTSEREGTTVTVILPGEG